MSVSEAVQGFGHIQWCLVIESSREFKTEGQEVFLSLIDPVARHINDNTWTNHTFPFGGGNLGFEVLVGFALVLCLDLGHPAMAVTLKLL